MTGFLIDPFNRVIDYLRVSITDLCNLRCVYCRPREGVQLVSHRDILRYEEIITIVEVARDLGVRKIRVTGGEPLVRRGAMAFVDRLTAMDGIEDVGLTTNGVLLAPVAAELKAAGLRRINVSLDTLRPDVFRAVTCGDHLGDVLAGIAAALDAGFDHVKVNVVLLKGFNEADVPEFARLTLDRPLDIRFIERMPFGAVPGSPDPFSAEQALDIIRSTLGELRPLDRSPLDGPARMFRLAGAAGRIGVIDPITGHFCGTCNRLRLTARGALRPCLLGPTEIDIKTPLRQGATRNRLADIIRAAVLAKPVGRAAHLHTGGESMNMIGG